MFSLVLEVFFALFLSNVWLDAIDVYLCRESVCDAITLSCPSSRPVAQTMGDNAGTSPSDLFPQLGANWQQRPPGPALIRTILTSSSHPAPHQCSDSAEEWIRPGGKHQPRHNSTTLCASGAFVCMHLQHDNCLAI